MTTTTIPTTETEAERLREIADRGEILHQEREAAMREVFALIGKLVPAVDAAVGADVQMRVIRGQLGQHEVYRDARERIVAHLHGRLGALRPFIPFVSDPEKG